MRTWWTLPITHHRFVFVCSLSHPATAAAAEISISSIGSLVFGISSESLSSTTLAGRTATWPPEYGCIGQAFGLVCLRGHISRSHSNGWKYPSRRPGSGGSAHMCLWLIRQAFHIFAPPHRRRVHRRKCANPLADSEVR
jgi:hypothetical protein